MNPARGGGVTAVMRSAEEMKAWAGAAGLALEAYEAASGITVPGQDELPGRFGVSPHIAGRVTATLSGVGLLPGGRLCREDITADPVLMVLAGAAMARHLAVLYPSRERSLEAAGKEFLDAASLPGAGILLRHRAEDFPAEARALIDAHLTGDGETGTALPGISDRQAGECADQVMDWISTAGRHGMVKDRVRSTGEISTVRDIGAVIVGAVRESGVPAAAAGIAAAAVRTEVDRRLAARPAAAASGARAARPRPAAPTARRAG